jgi:hypothetical protein
MSYKLPSGRYFIRNEGAYAGRNLHEDRSLLPKKVFCPTDSREPEVVSALTSDGDSIRSELCPIL